MKEWTIYTEESQVRLDKYLRRLFPQAAGGFLYRMLRKKNITLNGKKATGSERLQEGDVVRAYFSDETFEKLAGIDHWKDEYKALQNVSCSLQVLFEDEDLLFCNKPAGWLSQKAYQEDISLNERLRAYLIQQEGYSLDQYRKYRPSVMNRLDRGTSGVVAAAKSLSGARKLAEWIKNHSLTKEYICLVRGVFSKEGSMVSYLKKDREHNRSQLVDDASPGVWQVETEYSSIKTDGVTTLVKAKLVTGKSHQIRVQLSAVGHPIVLDAKYGNQNEDRILKKQLTYPGQLLHARRLVLPDGREIIAPTPNVFEKTRQLLKRATDRQ